jgi:hypothetical protein
MYVEVPQTLTSRQIPLLLWHVSHGCLATVGFTWLPCLPVLPTASPQFSNIVLLLAIIDFVAYEELFAGVFGIFAEIFIGMAALRALIGQRLLVSCECPGAAKDHGMMYMSSCQALVQGGRETGIIRFMHDLSPGQ